jgi:hypothetical protein
MRGALAWGRRGSEQWIVAGGRAQSVTRSRILPARFRIGEEFSAAGGLAASNAAAMPVQLARRGVIDEWRHSASSRHLCAKHQDVSRRRQHIGVITWACHYTQKRRQGGGGTGSRWCAATGWRRSARA